MALFDALIDDLASRFGLGATAAPLTREALALIVGAEGGLAGFLNLFKGAGFDAQVGSWLGRSDPQPVTAGDLGKALGAPAIDGIATGSASRSRPRPRASPMRCPGSSGR